MLYYRPWAFAQKADYGTLYSSAGKNVSGRHRAKNGHTLAPGVRHDQFGASSRTGGLETDPPLPLHPGWVGPGKFYGLIGAKNVAVRNVLFQFLSTVRFF